MANKTAFDRSAYNRRVAEGSHAIPAHTSTIKERRIRAISNPSLMHQTVARGKVERYSPETKWPQTKQRAVEEPLGLGRGGD